jgi:dihydrofolate reductase
LIISIIVAMDRKRGIGLDNKLPWRLPADLKRFRELTMGHHIIVGRKTFESIGKPLPGRQIIIVTRDRKYRREGSLVVHSVEDAISLAQSRGESEVFVCGGAEIYARTLPLAEKIYLTLVDAEVAADTFFPQWNEQEWREEESIHSEADEKNEYPHVFRVLKRTAA